MAFVNVGAYDAGVVGGPRAAGGNMQNVLTMDDAAVQSGNAFLVSELEKRDTLIRKPLNSTTYARDIPIQTGGGWVTSVSALSVAYGVTGGSGNSAVSAADANGVPIIQASLSKGDWRAHSFSMAMRIPFEDMQRANFVGRSLNTLLQDGIRMAYDKHLDENVYKGFANYGTTGLLNNPDVTEMDASATGSSSGTAFTAKTPDQILKDINDAITTVWEANGWDRSAIPNHILMPYQQYNYIATTRLDDIGQKTILTFLLENNVAKQNGVDLFIGATAWCKDAGGSGVDRMVVYVHNRRFVQMDELSPLSRVMTGPVPTLGVYDSLYKANLSEVELAYTTSMLYVDKI